jgi:DNA-binding XRE family transcriptional regulator
MTLREYLFKNRMTATEMAKKLGVHRNHLTLIKNEKILPGYELAVKIELMTGGEVSVKELRP